MSKSTKKREMLSKGKKYRKKPIVIEAEQYDPVFNKYIVGVKTYLKKTGKCNKCGCYWIEHGVINTLEGEMIVCPGDWVITGIAGEKYPCKPDIFEKTYEEVKSLDENIQ